LLRSGRTAAPRGVEARKKPAVGAVAGAESRRQLIGDARQRERKKSFVLDVAPLQRLEGDLLGWHVPPKRVLTTDKQEGSDTDGVHRSVAGHDSERLGDLEVGAACKFASCSAARIGLDRQIVLNIAGGPLPPVSGMPLRVSEADQAGKPDPVPQTEEVTMMATLKQVQAARRNVKKAQAEATKKQTIAHLPHATRHSLSQQAAASRQRRGAAGHALEDRNRQQLYEIAKQRQIPGRSKMGKWDLIKAIRKTR
jgi:hypothetical protein